MTSLFRIFRLTLIFSFALLLLSGCGSLINQPPAESFDGLMLVATKPMDAIYKKEGTDFSIYHKFKVSDCSVAFQENWQRDQNRSTRDTTRRISDSDMLAIKTRLSALCHDIFVEELEREGGYPVVETAAANVLEIRPGITDLVINAPDIPVAGRSRMYTTSEGSMKLYLEAYDSVTGEILARIIDKRVARDTGELRWTNAVTNEVEARRILRHWGISLRRMADRVHAK